MAPAAEESPSQPQNNQTAVNAEDTPGETITYVNRKMAFICSKGNLDMAYPALIMAHAALNQGVHVDIFFTFWGLDIINKRTMDDLKFTMQANTAIHMPALDKFYPGWGNAYMPPSLGVLPGMTSLATWYMKREIDKMEIPPVRDLLEQVAQMGANMWACKMTADLLQLKPRMLHKAVKGIIDVDGPQCIGPQNGFRAAHVGTHASNVEQGFHGAADGGVLCQLFAAGTVREVTGKGFGFVSGFGQLGHGAFQFCGSAAYQNHMISGFTDQLGRGAAHAAAAAGNHTDRFHLRFLPYLILPVSLSQAAVSWSVSA